MEPIDKALAQIQFQQQEENRRHHTFFRETPPENCRKILCAIINTCLWPPLPFAVGFV